MKLGTTLVSAVSLALVLLLAGLSATAADSRPNFTGTWELDQSRSHSIPPDMKQTMTVVHEGDRVSVATKIVNRQGERTVNDSYTLDGKQVDFTPPPPPPPPQPPPAGAPAPPAPKGKRAARWLPGGKGFVVEEEITTETPQGTSHSTVARKWIIWPDGTLSVEIQTEDARGSFSSKRIFVNIRMTPN